jgi:Fe-S-cluster containining protein
MSKLPIIQEEKPWYHKGLHFKCTGCGKCCSGSPGYVFLTEEDIARFTKHLNITTEVFTKRYTKFFHGRLSLRDDTPNYGCIFLKEGKYCGAYEARPSQCRNYPFWPMNLSSEQQWEEEAQRCEGINHPDAPLISAKEIEAIRDLDMLS